MEKLSDRLAGVSVNGSSKSLAKVKLKLAKILAKRKKDRQMANTNVCCANIVETLNFQYKVS